MTPGRTLIAGALVLAVAACPERDNDLDEALPDRLLHPAGPAPDPVMIPKPPPPPPRPDPGPMPPPTTGDPEARAVVLGKADAESVVRRTPSGDLQVGAVILAADKSSMRVPARINQIDGIIEYLAVGSKGKTHESVLVLEAEGTHLMVGCILLGLTPAPLTPQTDPGIRIIRGGQGANAKAGEGGQAADPAPPRQAAGAGVTLELEWVDPQTKKTVRRRAEDLTWSRKRSATMPRTNWVFTGSKLWRGNFVAELEQSYVATWPDGGALFNNPLPSQNPYRGNLLGYEANKRALPPIGTAATLIVTPAGPAVP